MATSVCWGDGRCDYRVGIKAELGHCSMPMYHVDTTVLHMRLGYAPNLTVNPIHDPDTDPTYEAELCAVRVLGGVMCNV